MEIKRDIIEKLKAWKENPRRKPLVLQGARQVGKSWALKKFGKECFDDIVYINFDTMPALKEDFRRTKVPAHKADGDNDGQADSPFVYAYNS